MHHWVGRAAAALAVTNTFWGIIRVRQLGAWAVATYSVVIGLIVAAGLALDARRLARRWAAARRCRGTRPPTERGGSTDASGDSV